MIVAVIPARYSATRFPGKPLIDLEGSTMIERVWRAVHGSTKVDRLIVATDDQRIAKEVARIGGEAVITDPDLPSGTDRCYAAVIACGLAPEVVINVQADEPLLTPGIIDSLIDALESSDADVATPIMRITDQDELDDPSVVKVTVGEANIALYFSRSPIPFMRGSEKKDWLTAHTYWKHAGIYAYRFAALQQHISLPPSSLEQVESLEQLRLLENGKRFLCVPMNAVLKSVDTPSDAERVREYLRISGNR